ncbi:MAG TPA: alpha-amylase family glycosyl hydrolase [Chitinophagaceae bacterium]|nr:alpha-amylase family glycosyl hydrolase [Chitinophagaceae bacterium]
MKRLALIFFIFFTIKNLHAQLLSWSTDFPKDNDNITITVDATKGNKALEGFSGNVYVHVGVITNLSSGPANWKYVKFTWGSTEAAAQATAAGTNKWTYTINSIRTFFNVPGGEFIQKISILFRSGNCNNDCIVQRNTDGSDMYVPVYDNNLAVRFSDPFLQPNYIPIPEPINKNLGESINITALASASSNMRILLNGTVVQSANNVTRINANPTLTVAGNQTIVAEATVGATTKTETINFFISGDPTIAPLPAAVRDGINYEAGNTSVVLVLNAPGKNRVSVIGSFAGSNWTEQTAYQMNKTADTNYWWIRITGLTPGTEYAYQYLVDGQLKIADPYAEKILDPWNDGFISPTTYPGLMPYPTQTTGIVSVLQTAQPSYTWHVNNFSRPDKRGLIIYELLLRDFVAAHDWKTLRDTLNYLKNMGVNAIELLPFNEFEGNNSWGYNPDFYFAPDKYYGTKNSLKEFIDSCHKKGIAVIMDIALNHSFGLAPYVQLYWDAANNRPAANNPWFNPEAKHPFNVGYDMNHESLATRYYFSRVVEHWLTEYKLDGFRFDLSKGFTQVNYGTNVGAWGQYDPSRVAIWKRYYDTLQLKSPGSYVILEHFADNSEEIELSNYGMLLWGNSNHSFSEAAMGFVPTSNFEYGIFKVRNWTQPHLITYMESHDEERIMYKNLNFGNSSGAYNTRNLSTALKRMEISAAFLTMIPGPKMIWQFGETGYDYSINYCQNGSINSNCRTDPKPIQWDYLQEAGRKRLYDTYSALLKLRFHPAYNSAFITNRVTHSLSGGFKWLQVTTDTSNLCLIGNFDVIQTSGQVTFQSAGTWYDYLNGNTFTATGGSQSITLLPGEFRLFLNRNITNVITTPVSNINNPANSFKVSVYPNPLAGAAVLQIENKEAGLASIQWYNEAGQKVKEESLGTLEKGVHKIQIAGSRHKKMAPGTYLLRVQIKNQVQTQKIILL